MIPVTMLFFLIRHGDPHYPTDGLTPAGRLEAEALGVRMAKIAPELLFSSPLGRARATAEPTARRLEKAVTIEEWSREIHLTVNRPEPELPEGHAAWDVHGETIRASTGRMTGSWIDVADRFSESDASVHLARIGRSVDDFFARLGFESRGGWYEKRPDAAKKVALFAHGGLGLFVLSHLLDLPLPSVCASFFLPPSSVTTILFDERRPGRACPRAIGVGDVSHLYAAGLTPSTSGLKANVD